MDSLTPVHMVFFHPSSSHGTSRAALEGDPALPQSITIAISLLAVFVLGVTLILAGLG